MTEEPRLFWCICCEEYHFLDQIQENGLCKRGLGGWTARDIAPLFSGASSNVYFDTIWREHLPQDAAFWGTF